METILVLTPGFIYTVGERNRANEIPTFEILAYENKVSLLF